MHMYKGQKRSSSWQRVSPWYSKVTNRGQGHYYHEHVVIPGTLKLLGLKPVPTPKLLDLACGNGVLAKSLPRETEYTGVDLAPGLINEAKRTDRNRDHKYFISDITKPLILPTDFTHAAIILALQNVENPGGAIKNAAKHLVKNGTLVMVINHPTFRIPRQSSWGIDEGRKIQYRRVDKYLSPMTIPINMNPSDRNSETTLSYHLPLSDYSKMLMDAGFAIELIEEWASDKESVGSVGRMENRSRQEIPLFMAIVATKR